jgi:hypothetical protein
MWLERKLKNRPGFFSLGIFWFLLKITKLHRRLRTAAWSHSAHSGAVKRLIKSDTAALSFCFVGVSLVSPVLFACFFRPDPPLEQVNLEHFTVASSFQTMGCFVNKVASSSLVSAFLLVNGYGPSFDSPHSLAPFLRPRVSIPRILFFPDGSDGRLSPRSS